MYSLDILIGTGLCALILGGLIGIFFGRRSTASSQQARALEQRIEELNREKQAYENKVTAHFTETADRLNTLTDMYRGIHEHLAEGANTLVLGKETVTVKRLTGSDDGNDVPDKALNTEPPRDYAPRSDGETGMLNESFGIERERLPGNRGPRDPDVDSDTTESDGAANGETPAAGAGDSADDTAEAETAQKKDGA